MLVMVVFFIAFRWIHLSTPLIRLFLLVLILLLMPTLNFLPVWFALSLLRFRLPSRLPMMFILWMVAMMVVIIDRKSGSAGMPRPISYAVFCLKKKSESLSRKGGGNLGQPGVHPARRRQLRLRDPTDRGGQARRGDVAPRGRQPHRLLPAVRRRRPQAEASRGVRHVWPRQRTSRARPRGGRGTGRRLPLLPGARHRRESRVGAALASALWPDLRLRHGFGLHRLERLAPVGDGRQPGGLPRARRRDQGARGRAHVRVARGRGHAEPAEPSRGPHGEPRPRQQQARVPALEA